MRFNIRAIGGLMASIPRACVPRRNFENSGRLRATALGSACAALAKALASPLRGALRCACRVAAVLTCGLCCGRRGGAATGAEADVAAAAEADIARRRHGALARYAGTFFQQRSPAYAANLWRFQRSAGRGGKPQAGLALRAAAAARRLPGPERNALAAALLVLALGVGVLKSFRTAMEALAAAAALLGAGLLLVALCARFGADELAAAATGGRGGAARGLSRRERAQGWRLEGQGMGADVYRVWTEDTVAALGRAVGAEGRAGGGVGGGAPSLGRRVGGRMRVWEVCALAGGHSYDAAQSTDPRYCTANRSPLTTPAH